MTNVVPVIVKGSITMLKVAETVLFRTTPVERLAGSVMVTVGAAPVVNVQT